MTTLEAQHEVITNLILENQKLKQERDEARNKMADALQEVDLRILCVDRMNQECYELREELRTAVQERHDFHWELLDAIRERDELRKELEEYRSIAENIGAKKAVSEKEKAIREHDEAREALSSIALYLSVGMGDETTTAQQYEQRILDGIKMLTEPIADLWKQAEKECNKMREALMAIEDRCVDCEDACDDIQKIRDIARAGLEK